MIKLLLQRDIYSIENVYKAKIEYKGYANILISQDNEYIKLRFMRCKYDQERTIKEFENYLIGLENS